ncbi:hypothetical protein GCM10011511_48350 [Puia dinghuensis]|uniref:Gliding motility-associated C-terminal domain-containing protein n=1 Tax=Puia dinghuensis TaxID=1792502 RepID=A0A8J2XVI9_9BACT|nr:hypothetical protein GCM10011511_48350 [Puia dinghuensis]
MSVTAVATSAECGHPDGTVTATGAGGAGAYTYSLNGPGYTSGFTPNNYYNNLGSGTYTLTVADGVNAPVTISVTVNIGCITLLTTPTTATCGGANGAWLLTESGGVGTIRYSIDGGKTFQSTTNTSYTFSNIPGGLYNIVVEDAQNTIQRASVILGGIAGPSVTATPQAASCAGNDGTVTVSATGGLPPLTYKIDAGAYGSSPDFSGVTSGAHTVYVEDGNSCVSTAVVTVPLTNSLVLTAGGDATICESKSARLKAGTNESNVSYSWSPAASLSNASSASPVASPDVTTTYTVTATWEACVQTAAVTVTVNPAPVASAATTADTTCYGKSVVLQGTGAAAGGAGGGTFTYSWKPFTFLNDAKLANPTVVQPTATTTYSLQVKDVNGCVSLNNAAVTVNVLPPAQLLAGDDTNVVAGQPVPLHAIDVSNSGFVAYQWTPPDGLSDPYSANPVVLEALLPTEYVVTGTTADGCMGVDTVVVKVYSVGDIFVPNAFTPNHDGHNDVLRVTAPGMRVVSFGVWDRWGTAVFVSTNTGVGWDGTRNGKELPPGTYVWLAVGVDIKGRTVERRGTVLLVR